MNIGYFKKNAQGLYFGHIAAAKFELPQLALRPCESTKERAPTFEVMTRTPGNRLIQVGALWEARANGTGEVFLQGSVDDPSLPDRVSIALFHDGADGMNVAWRRARVRRDPFRQPVDAREPVGGGDDAHEDMPF
ncbi:DUF736 family protein [uncultured Sphingomonas sp.]|uniref:DUF736 family protein n=1 Tax=uncultured Sphingomonas sp. TaxID=158754 RepID=UPI0035CA2E42